MFQRRRMLAQQALTQAMRTRQKAGVIRSDVPICIYDIAERLGIDVNFVDLPSTEGVYNKGDPPLIVVTSRKHRPSGRQVYSCAHELGHHVFHHGTRSDELVEAGADSDEEYIAQCFAGLLLMPKTAIMSAFTVHRWPLNQVTPQQIYVVADMMGVGYTTLIDHMNLMLKLLTREQADSLKRVSLSRIRHQWLQFDLEKGHELRVVDQYWPAEHRAVDVQVGDYVCVPPGTHCEGRSLDPYDGAIEGELLRAIRPGIDRLCNPAMDWAIYTRISRENFTGWSVYRHLEDPDDDFK